MPRGELQWWDILERVAKKGQHFRALLWGPPGTGKSSWVPYTYPEYERITVNEESAPEDLVGSYLLRGGDTVWADGPAVRAFRKGVPLVIDEIHRAAAAVETLLHAVLDDFSIASLTLPTGEVVRPKSRGEFIVVATMNASPTSLDEALLDRFDIILHVQIPHPNAVTRVDPQYSRGLMNYYARQKNKNGDRYSRAMSLRTVIAFTKLVSVLDERTAAALTWGEEAAEEVLTLFNSANRTE